MTRTASDLDAPTLMFFFRSSARRREIQASSFVDFGPMVPILVGHCNSKDRFNRLTAVQWVHEFIKLGVRIFFLLYNCITSSVNKLTGQQKITCTAGTNLGWFFVLRVWVFWKKYAEGDFRSLGFARKPLLVHPNPWN